MVMGKQPNPWHWIAARDYARMVSSAYSSTESEGKILYVYGPEAITMAEAVDRYRAICAPEAKLTHVPFWELKSIVVVS